MKSVLIFISQLLLLANCIDENRLMRHVKEKNYQLLSGRDSKLRTFMNEVPITSEDFLEGEPLFVERVLSFVGDKFLTENYGVDIEYEGVRNVLNLFFKDIYFTRLEYDDTLSDAEQEAFWGHLGKEFWMTFVFSLGLERANIAKICKGNYTGKYNDIPSHLVYVGEHLKPAYFDMQKGPVAEGIPLRSMEKYKPYNILVPFDKKLRSLWQSDIDYEIRLGPLLLILVEINQKNELVKDEEGTRLRIKTVLNEVPLKVFKKILGYFDDMFNSQFLSFMQSSNEKNGPQIRKKWLWESSVQLKKCSFAALVVSEIFGDRSWTSICNEIYKESNKIARMAEDLDLYSQQRKSADKHLVFKLYLNSYNPYDKK